MKLAILGTRGIPNNYGGFEQLAEFLSQGLVKNGHEVFVYSTSDHVYQDVIWNGVKLVHKYNPEKKIGTWGQFIYDLLCILDARGRRFDVILQLGYTSSSVWSWVLPRFSSIVTNMDGLEWKRTKHNRLARWFLRHAEKWAVNSSDHLVSDSLGIQDYLLRSHNAPSTYIPYGTHHFTAPREEMIAKYGLTAYSYNMLIARIEPENNIDTILNGVVRSKSNRVFLVIGNVNANRFGEHLLQKFGSDHRIKFLGPIYNMEILDNLRFYSHLYFHGHSVGGTNPSLLEAMASSCMICAHSNPFNKAILNGAAYYFVTPSDVSNILDREIRKSDSDYLEINLRKVNDLFLWPKIIRDYESLLLKAAGKKNDNA